MLTTDGARRAWAPACAGKGGVFLNAYQALDSCLRDALYAPRAGVTGAYNCRKITGGTGHSLHAYGPGNRFTFWTGVNVTTALAVDINWDTNPYGPRLVTDFPARMVAAIKAIRTNSGAQVWRWGGDYTGNKDAMHFEIVCTPQDLASGIRPHVQEDDMTPDESAQLKGTADAAVETRDNVRKLVNMVSDIDKRLAALEAKGQ